MSNNDTLKINSKISELERFVRQQFNKIILTNVQIADRLNVLQSQIDELREQIKALSSSSAVNEVQKMESNHDTTIE